MLSKRISTFFLAKCFFRIRLESSEMNFVLVASKIGAKLNNFVIYGDILVNFLRISKTENRKNLKKLFFHSYQSIAHLLGQKKNMCSFFYLSILITKCIISQKLIVAENRKLFFNLFQKPNLATFEGGERGVCLSLL